MKNRRKSRNEKEKRVIKTLKGRERERERKEKERKKEGEREREREREVLKCMSLMKQVSKPEEHTHHSQVMPGSETQLLQLGWHRR